MLVTWMAYATLFAALITLGALALEKLIDLWNGPRRAVWIIALVAGAVVPPVLAVRRVPPPQSAADDRVVITGADLAALGRAKQPSRVATVSRSAHYDFSAWNRPLAATWVAASALLLAVGLGGVVRVALRRRAWRRARVAGEPVLVARDAGPAVVGTLRPNIVLPEWALSLAGNEQLLILKHEKEHVRARDPLLLVLAGVIVALFPWNAALWFAASRLRLAIEIDCDARVLRAAGGAREYGLLLLAVGARRTASLPMAASLAERRPLLEWRIRAMTAVRPSKPVLASLPFAALVLAAVSVAAQTPRPAPIPVAASAPAAPAPALAEAPVGIAAPAAAPVAASAPRLSVTPRAAAPVAANVGDAPTVAPAPAAAPMVGVAVTADVAPEAQLMRPRIARAALRGDSIPFATLQAWISQFYPALMLGDTSVNRLTILVDANGNYVRSVADKIAATMTNTVMFRRAGNFQGDSVVTLTTSTGLALRKQRLDSMTAVLRDRVQGNEPMSTAGDSVSATVVARVRGALEKVQVAERTGPLASLGVDPETIKSVETISFREGKIVPTALHVTIVWQKE